MRTLGIPFIFVVLAVLVMATNNEIYNNTAGITISGDATGASVGNNRVMGNGSSTAPSGAASPIQ